MNKIKVFYNNQKEVHKDVAELTLALDRARVGARRVMAETEAPHVLYAIKQYDAEDNLASVHIYSPALNLTDEELDEIINRHPYSLFLCFHNGTHKKACVELEDRRKSQRIQNITLKEANAFVNDNHRHHKGTAGCKFAIGLYEKDKLIGVAICGRPVSRYLDNGKILEINRVCTKSSYSHNACSRLYGACCRIAKEMGYEKVITYILASENGSSLKASNFICEGTAGGTHWTGSRDKGQDIPQEMKLRFSKQLQ